MELFRSTHSRCHNEWLKWLDRSRWLVAYRDRSVGLEGERRRRRDLADLRDASAYTRVIAQLFERATIYSQPPPPPPPSSSTLSTPMTNSETPAVRSRVGLVRLYCRRLAISAAPLGLCQYRARYRRYTVITWETAELRPTVWVKKVASI